MRDSSAESGQSKCPRNCSHCAQPAAQSKIWAFAVSVVMSDDDSDSEPPQIVDPVDRVAEAQVPASYAAGASARGGPPLRLLDDFTVLNAKGQLCSLDALEAGGSGAPHAASLCVRGVLLEPTDDMDPRPGVPLDACTLFTTRGDSPRRHL